MHVCQFWWDIAKATPQLWTNLHIRHPHQYADPAGLSQWLKNSGKHPLDVILKIPLRVTKLQPMLAPLHDHVRRFCVLDINVPATDVVDIIIPSIALSGGVFNGNTAPLLEELSIVIEVANRIIHNDQCYFEHTFHPSPRLQSLTFSPERTPQLTSKFLSTISTLTIVSGPNEQAMHVEQTLDTITVTSHLKYLKYSGYDPFSYQDTYNLDHPRIVPLPYLEEADVTVPGCGLDVLQCLEAPTLWSVQLDGWREEGFEEDWDDEGFTNVSASLKCLPQQAPCIQKLNLHCIEGLRADTYNWLFNQTDFAQLEELHIEGSAMTDVPFAQSSSHGPRLCQLKLINCEHITGSTLIAYIEARQTSGHVEDFLLLVSGCPGVGDEHLVQLSHLVTVEGIGN